MGRTELLGEIFIISFQNSLSSHEWNFRKFHKAENKSPRRWIRSHNRWVREEEWGKAIVTGVSVAVVVDVIEEQPSVVENLCQGMLFIKT